MRILKFAQRWFELRDARTAISRALLVAQFKVLRKQVPILYAVIVAESISIAYVLPASLPPLLRFGPPSAFLVLSVVRIASWLTHDATEPSVAEARRELARARPVSIAFSIVFAAWVLALFEGIDPDARVPIALLAFLGAIGSAYCLASFPAAARSHVLLAGAPIALRLAVSGDATALCLGVNRLLLLALVMRMINVHYSDFVTLVASRARVTAEREQSRAARRAAIAEQEKLRELASRFDTAINNMTQGLCFFDGQHRLIAWNRLFTELYRVDPAKVQRGTTLKEIIDLRFEAGSFPRMTREEYLTWRTQVAVSDKPSDTIVELADGRVFEIRHRPMPDGGWVATHQDVTAKFMAEQTLAVAKAAAERAEQEARAAHARLVAALDVVPEGLVIFDAEDRYVLWNKKYAEIYGKSLDLLAEGVRFEDVLRAGLARGHFPEAIGREREWLEERMALHMQPQSRHEQQLGDGRWCRIEERRMPDGGSIGIRVDITDLKEREAMFRMMFDSNPVPMWVFDRETFKFLAVNDAVVAHYGYTRDEFMNLSLLDIRPPEDREKVREAVRSADAGSIQFRPWRHFKADGTAIEVESYFKRIQYQGRPATMAAIIDVTERKQAERRIAHSAQHDALTDLPNRTALDQHFQTVLAQAEATGGSFAVLCIDLDRFKEINDLHGHSVGDAVLRSVSQRLRAACQGAFLARIGGDEFVAVATDSRARIEALAQRLEGALDGEVEADGHAFELDLSIGIAVFPDDGRDATTLIANADAALYRAKHDGRGTTRVFTAAMDQQLRERRALERDLRVALEKTHDAAGSELSLDYQPQARADGTILGFEALARWRHPLRGAVAPAEFIPVAEESGLIVELGEWVLRRACGEAAAWQQPLKVSVNVSAVQFRRGNLQAMVHAVLLETGLKPERLELEITEGMLIENVSRAAATLRNLKALGIRIALDDFGTGYSSLSYLQSFPLDRIKIDRTFVRTLGRGEGSLAIVRGVIGLAHGLALPVVAEGVETAEQLAMLVQEGCDEVQGYLIGRPGPIERYVEMVGQQVRVAAAS